MKSHKSLEKLLLSTGDKKRLNSYLESERMITISYMVQSAIKMFEFVIYQ